MVDGFIDVASQLSINRTTFTTYTTARKVMEFNNLYTLEIGEAVGTGTGTQTIFNLANKRVIESFETMFVAGVKKSRFTDYNIDYDAGQVTFIAAPALGQAVTSDYAWTDIPSSVIVRYILRVEEEIDRRIGWAFRLPVEIREIYDGSYLVDVNPHVYQPTGYTQEMEIFKDQKESMYVFKALHLNKYPITKVKSMSVSTVIPQSGSVTQAVTIPSGGATAFTNDTSDLLIYPEEGVVVLKQSAGLRFKTGIKNIDIVYEYGYPIVPFVVEELATKLTALYVIESRLLGSPTPLSIPAGNIRSIREDIDYLYETLGRKLEIRIV